MGRVGVSSHAVVSALGRLAHPCLLPRSTSARSPCSESNRRRASVEARPRFRRGDCCTVDTVCVLMPSGSSRPRKRLNEEPHSTGCSESQIKNKGCRHCITRSNLARMSWPASYFVYKTIFGFDRVCPTEGVGTLRVKASRHDPSHFEDRSHTRSLDALCLHLGYALRPLPKPRCPKRDMVRALESNHVGKPLRQPPKPR